MKQLFDNFSTISIFLTLTGILLLQTTFAQKIEIVSDPQNIFLDQDFVITTTIPFQRKIKAGNFPEISDFAKKDTRFVREDSIIKISQHYRARKTGDYQLAPFKIYINDQWITYNKSTNITVRKASQKAPKETITNGNLRKDFEPEELQARLFIKTNKSEVYKNETFRIRIYLEIESEDDPEFNFINLQNQLGVITKKLVPENGLHQFQDFGIIKQDTSTSANTKTFILADLLIAPGTAQNIIIPAIQFNLLTYEKRRSKELIERQDNIITLSSAPLKIQVKDLPAEFTDLTPGKFNLRDITNRNNITVNQSFSYQFIVMGEATSLFNSRPIVNTNLPVNVFQVLDTKNNQNDGNQYFTYQIVPTQTGNLLLKDLFYWPYFNTKTNKPDTLRPSRVIHVYGKSNQDSQSYQESPFYKEIDTANNTLRPIRKDNMLNLFTNLVILFMFAVTAILIIRK